MGRRKNPVILKNPFNNVSMLPGRFHTKCYTTFYGTLDLTGLAAGIAGNIFVKSNSIWQPWNSVTANNNLLTGVDSFDYQNSAPYGLSQFLGQPATTTCPYQNYRVYSSKINVELISQTNTDNTICVINPMDINSLTGTNYKSWDYVSCAPDRKMSKIAVHDTHSAYVKNYTTTARTLGVSKSSIQDNSNYAASAGADPVTKTIWNVMFSLTSPNNNWTNELHLRIKVMYWIELFGLNEVSQTITN